jgi:hypothetical protein
MIRSLVRFWQRAFFFACAIDQKSKCLAAQLYLRAGYLDVNVSGIDNAMTPRVQSPRSFEFILLGHRLMI